jgi:hypothetical protein
LRTLCSDKEAKHKFGRKMGSGCYWALDFFLGVMKVF